MTLVRGAMRVVVALAMAVGLVCLAHPRVAECVPVIVPFPEFIASEGATYAGVLYLDEWVEDSSAGDADLVWSFPEATDLVVDLTGDRHLIVRPPTKDWFGVGSIPLTVCNPRGECATQTVSFRVENLPDDPALERIPEQIVGRCRAFPRVDLSLFGWDADGSPGLFWSVRGGAALAAELRGTCLEVRPIDADWVGSEAVEVTLSDPTGRRATRDVVYTVTDEEPVTLTFLGTEGFLIQWGEEKVLIDALVREGMPLTASERGRLQLALSPFEDVRLTLASHEHWDHFDAGYVVEYLQHSPEARFVSVAEAVDRLGSVEGFSSVSDRIATIPFREFDRTELDVAGIHVTAFHLDHTISDVWHNVAWLVEIGGLRILHLGDSSEAYSVAELVAAFDWPSLDIDVALVPPKWVASGDPGLLMGAVKPRYAFVMHLGSGCPSLGTYLGEEGPDVVLWPLDRWIVPRVEP
jgi:L-ascorbate metabolism protein UlaG (beta-lactamase superfamily)